MEIFIILGLILLNGVLAMSEIALVSVRKTRLETEAKKGSASAKTALRLANQPDRFLSTVQIGITLIGILTGLYSGEAFASDFAVVVGRVSFLEPYALSIATITIVVVVTYLTLIFGELVPKRLGMVKAERMAKLVAAPMNVLSRIASPLIWLLSKSTLLVLRVLGIGSDESSSITEEEIKAIVKEGYNTGEVQEVEHDIVERVFNLGDRDVESLMTHRTELVWLDVADSRDTIRKKVIESQYSLYPVLSGSFSHILGVVYLKDLFGQLDEPDFSLERLVHPPHYLPESQSVYIALEQFRKVNVKYGFIIDEFGEIQGIVTLNDITEAIIGQVYESNKDAEIVVRDDGSLLVDGQCSFYNFLEYCDCEDLYANHDYNTLGGLILEELEHVPVTGEKLMWHNFMFEIIDMDGARIDKVLVTRNN